MDSIVPGGGGRWGGGEVGRWEMGRWGSEVDLFRLLLPPILSPTLYLESEATQHRIFHSPPTLGLQNLTLKTC
jgi:hypothetical protein